MSSAQRIMVTGAAGLVGRAVCRQLDARGDDVIAIDRFGGEDIGGVSVTEHTALAVMPQRPPGPSVVMMLTAADRYAMASRNSLRVFSLFMSCSPVHANTPETPEYNGLDPESCCASRVAGSLD